MVFADRVEAGRRLAEALQHLAGQPLVVLGLPRGGVVVAAEVAAALAVPLDVVVVRKLGVPEQPELAMGAVGEGDVTIRNEPVLQAIGVPDEVVADVADRERAEVRRRATRLRAGRAPLSLCGRVAVIVDDGIATGSTARAACQVVRALGAARVVVAVPVAPPGWEAGFAGVADELVAVWTPERLWAIGGAYGDFHQVGDDEVATCLGQAAVAAAAGAAPGPVRRTPGGNMAGGSTGGGAVEAQQWDERYRSTELVWGAGPNRFLVEQVDGLVPGTALDLACGEGRNAIWLAEQGWKPTGVDFSAVALEKARRLATGRQVTVTWQQADVTAWEPSSSYDLVVVMYLQLPADTRRRALSAAARAVAPAGTLLVVGHAVSNLTNGYGGPQDPSVLYSPEDVVADLGGSLDVQQATEVRRPVATSEGEVEAIDVLVRATAPPEPRS